MIKQNSLVIYKSQLAQVIECGEKFTIQFLSTKDKKAKYETQSVRDKDIKLLHEGDKTTIQEAYDFANNTAEMSKISEKLFEAYELLTSDEETASETYTLQELAEYSIGEFLAKYAWAFLTAVTIDIHFVATEEATETKFKLRTQAEIQENEEKRMLKEKENAQKEGFIARIRQKKLDLPDDAKLMQEVEAFALGLKTGSKIMKEAGFKETPEKAHKLLLDTKIWTVAKNPHPTRFGLSMQSASEHLSTPPDEERFVVNHTAYAIDNEWSPDPDDAISFDGEYVWVHIADPASTVTPDSKIDIMARNRGATLYIPDGSARMLSEDCLEDYALGLTESASRALSFKIKLDENANILDTEVLKTLVPVKRLTYTEADKLKDTKELAPLFEIAEKSEQKRKKAGAVFIQIPDVHFVLHKNEDSSIPNVNVVPNDESPKSCDVVREFMLLAGEGAAKFAFKNNIPFPFISQTSPDIPKELPEGLAGQFRLRRSMHARSVGVTPASHAGLGLGMYSQVTSPLRRYGDLIAHQQLRAFLDKKPLLDKDKMLERISAGDAAGSATIKAQRLSEMHWKLVYLLQNPQWQGVGTVVELKGKQISIFIKELDRKSVV